MEAAAACGDESKRTSGFMCVISPSSLLAVPTIPGIMQTVSVCLRCLLPSFLPPSSVSQSFSFHLFLSKEYIEMFMLLKGAIHHGLYTLLLPVHLLGKEPLISSFAPLLFSPISSLALVFTSSHHSCTQFFSISSSPLLKSTVFASFLSSVLYFSPSVISYPFL